MPIRLDDLQASLQQPVNVYSPKFFSPKLTGKGGTSPGLLSEKNNPASIDPSVTTRLNDYMMHKRSYKSGNTTVNYLPMNPIPQEAWSDMETLKIPNLADMTLIGTGKTGRATHQLYMDIRIHAIGIEETVIAPDYHVGGQGYKNTEITTNYQIFLFDICDPSHPIAYHENNTACGSIRLTNNGFSSKSNKNRYNYKFSSNPMADMANDIYSQLTNDGWNIITRNIIDFFAQYEIYDAVVKRSEEWQTYVDKTLDEFLCNFSSSKKSFNTNENLLKSVMRWIMNYNIPLELYRNIYASIAKNFKPDETKMLCKQNLNLLLSDTLQNLDSCKQNITTFQQLDPNDPHPKSMTILTPEQRAAVIANEPLILVQSGAGCGKSSIILSRIDYLNACGVKPEDITVLSFTNAAADHITEKNPNVHSMTIARMIHEIYTTNFSNHDLSSIETIINSIDIYYPPKPSVTPPITRQFQDKLKNIVHTDPNAFTEMNNFIEAHYDEVIDILDTIGQTSLELEIIICYQKIDSFVEPPTITSKYLIIDEVQDNSIFEFVYMLKYVSKHLESLFIVGDCSQTLYEFRASNPRALNILEGSNTFKNYQLTVNFRSNQEILDFANIALENIEANQYAQIQLQANSLAKVTEQTFLDRVHFNYQRLGAIKEFHQILPDILATDMKSYIDDCIARGEQIAFLSFTRDDVKIINDILHTLYPTMTIVSLVPEKMYNTTVMSEFIRRYWNEINFIPAQNAVSTIAREIMARLQYLVYNDQKSQPKVQAMINEWLNSIKDEATTWLKQINNGQMTQDEFSENVKRHMLKFEIERNAIKQALLSSQNAKQKENDNVKNANILLSTIHSAKGLEFDNVVVFYRNESSLAEDKKRMYYVALTRAMKSEYILAYDTSASPQIQADYITVLERLHDIAPAPNSPIDALKEKRKNRIKI